MALFMVKTWMGNKVTPIYGAEWAGTSDPSWTRTDAAVGFSAPNPYYAGMSSSPSSPFDNIMPWSGMRRVTDANAGELVEIPKFYYKWTRDGVKMKLQISMSAFDGSHVSPAHADRGDGVGERNYVYIGRYHCAGDYKSKTGVKPVSEVTIATCRSNIANLGQYVWQYDFASYWTIFMLYLVEYANWNAQVAIGYGQGQGSSVGIENNGASDSMPYHTGTMQTSRDTKGVGVQYRYIEDLWANVIQYLDGVYANDQNVYCIKNPANFSNSSGGTKVGTRTAAYSGTSGYATAFSTPIATGFEYAIYPNANGGSDSTYITDNYYYSSSGTKFRVGGFYGGGKGDGPFHFHVYAYYSPDPRPEDSCRLMVLPPSRLSG